MAEVRYITVEAEQAGQRIDNFLMRFYRKVPKARIYRAVRKGECRVNKKRISATYRVQANDVVRLPPIDVQSRTLSAPGMQVVRALDQVIIYEDKDLMILNKPAGIPVHGGTGLEGGVINVLRVLRPEAPFLELVHRIDKATSGCLMVAKRRSALLQTQALMRERQVKKTYLLWVHGRWSRGCFVAAAPLLKKTFGEGRRLVVVSQQGKAAKTRFKPLKIMQHCSLLQAELLTGRTHQIRVHAADCGHPILGDPLYGQDHVNRALALHSSRMYLHAATLELQLKERAPIALSACLGPEWRLWPCFDSSLECI